MCGGGKASAEHLICETTPGSGHLTCDLSKENQRGVAPYQSQTDRPQMQLAAVGHPVELGYMEAQHQYQAAVF